MAGRFNDRVALITGGNAGIGLATAQLFARDGAKVVIAARREAEGEEAARGIRDDGGEASFVRADVGRASEVEAMVARTVELYGRLDYAFNNAGVLGAGKMIHEQTEEEWDTVIDINLKGVWLCMKYEVQQMMPRGSGAIVNVSSPAGFVGFPRGSGYVASKHAVHGLTKSAAAEYTPMGIRVNCICPGAIDTPMLSDLYARDEARDPERRERTLRAQPMQRFGRPEEIAEVCAWLCSDSASFVSGDIVVASGAATIRH